LIYAYIAGKNVYFLKILPHNNWTKDELIEIIFNDWPEILEPMRCKGVIASSWTPSEDDRKKLRKAHVNTTIDLGRNLVFMPGLGSTSAGNSIQSTIQTNKMKRYLEALENQVKSILENSTYKSLPGEMTVHLIRLGDRYVYARSGCNKFKYIYDKFLRIEKFIGL